MLRAAMQIAVDTIFPPHCIGCGAMVSQAQGLCPSCFRDTPFITGLVCDSCGTPLPGESAQAEQCDDCLAQPRPWSVGRAAVMYRDIGRKMVLGLKHGDRQDIAVPAGRWMARAIRPALSTSAEPPLIVPIPLHWGRLMKRRYNQSALLATEIGKCLSAPVCADGLRRPVATPSLDGKKREERFSTLAGRLHVSPARASVLRGRQILLVDDVMTSGATLASATGALLAAGAGPVCTVVLARVGKDA